jgi:DNA-binding NarL/FixJ family response regulator
MTKPITILVADDHPIFRRGVLDTLGAEPDLKIVREARDGEEALVGILELKPAVAVLDMNMPGRQGLDVARELRRRGSTTAVIILTMFDDEETFHAAMDAGVQGYLLKDSAVVDLLASVRAVVGGKTFITPTLAGYLLNRTQAGRELREERTGLDTLTAAERRILKLVASDKTSKEIAEELGLSPRTVETHRLNICQKLGLRGVHALVKFAFESKHRL